MTVSTEHSLRLKVRSTVLGWANPPCEGTQMEMTARHFNALRQPEHLCIGLEGMPCVPVCGLS